MTEDCSFTSYTIRSQVVRSRIGIGGIIGSGSATNRKN